MYMKKTLISFSKLNVYNPFYLIRVVLLILGVIVVLRADSKLGGWLGMEINVIGFLGILSVRGFMDISVGLKYFIVQVLGSGLFLMGVMVYYTGLYRYGGTILHVRGLIAELGLFCKAGIFPFHGWVPSVITCGDWLRIWLILRVQKLAPIVIIFVWRGSSLIYLGLVGLRIVGALGGLNQISVRGILVYSSFVHGGWILVALCNSIQLFFFYFLGYLIQLRIIVVLCYELSVEKSARYLLSVLGGVVSLSLRGLPPMGGFLFKLRVFLCTINLSLLIAPIVGSIISLFFYLRLINGFFTGNKVNFFSEAVRLSFVFILFNGFCYVVFGCIFRLLG